MTSLLACLVRHLWVLGILAVVAPPADAREVAYVLHQEEATILVIDTATNAVGARIGLTSVGLGLVAAPDGTRVYGPDTVGLAVIDTATNSVAGTIDLGLGQTGGHRADHLGAAAALASSRIAITPDGRSLYVPASLGFSGEARVAVVDTARKTVVAFIPTAQFPFAGAVSPDGRTVYVTIRVNQSNVTVIDAATNAVAVEIPFTDQGPLEGIVFSPDGGRAYVAGGQAVAVIDTQLAEVVNRIPVGFGAVAIALTPGGERAYVTNVGDNTVSVLDLSAQSAVATIPVGRDPFGLAITSDGASVYVANSRSDSVSVIDTATNTVTQTIPVGIGPSDIAIVVVPTPQPTATPTPVAPTPTMTETRSRSGGGGCSLLSAEPERWWWPLAAMAALAMDRWRRRHG